MLSRPVDVCIRVVVTVTTALMVFVATAACLVPAWDAGRSNPVAALRNE